MAPAPKTVTIPLTLFERLAYCYYGNGPRAHHTPEPLSSVGQELEPTYTDGGAGLPPEIARMMPRVKPIGMHKLATSDEDEIEG